MAVTYDFHVHSCLSPCGDEGMTPNNIAGMSMLNGIRVAALTDHNTCGNCPAFYEACRRVGVVPIAGMELTTVEEIHVVCLFPDLEIAMEFDNFVREHRLPIKNRPDIFGEQLIMNENDEIIGKEENLLIMATDLDITTVAHIVRDNYYGVAFPAHIDKQSNGIIGILGDFPKEPGFTAVEFHNSQNIEHYLKQYPILNNLLIVTDSDAHRLEDTTLEPACFDDIEDNEEEKIRRSVILKLRGEL